MITSTSPIATVVLNSDGCSWRQLSCVTTGFTDRLRRSHPSLLRHMTTVAIGQIKPIATVNWAVVVPWTEQNFVFFTNIVIIISDIVTKCPNYIDILTMIIIYQFASCLHLRFCVLAWYMWWPDREATPHTFLPRAKVPYQERSEIWNCQVDTFLQIYTEARCLL
jgi:hypothetical protein